MDWTDEPPSCTMTPWDAGANEKFAEEEVRKSAYGERIAIGRFVDSMAAAALYRTTAGIGRHMKTGAEK